MPHIRPAHARRLGPLGLALALGLAAASFLAVDEPAAAPPAAATPTPAASPDLTDFPARLAHVSQMRTGASRRGVVALTFDDGPSAYTPGILKVLKRHGVRATFFALGVETQKHPVLARRIVREGHRIGNHTWDHPDMRTLSDDGARSQITRQQRLLRQATGVTPTSFRFPYGATDARTTAIVASCGLRPVKWNIDTQDWERPGANRIRAHILGAVRKDRLNVVLMHDGGGNRANTVAALDRTIATLKARGYRFGVV
ncbi:hypothetical protein GCM10010124_20920 [Pilimelia terevasa]|uniref:NodB homology domain-containing protein n=1 Tax=Pilimelia terevasa TaxID=53372 RepID=A0A8J3BKR6_9ACTN|nr:polysaccharide deacetylase family protein [Pilimelia terevasa]GGK28121.1 hypothetical protein GCM10010124_20920 [Pilimelia terevasa]